MMVDLGKILIFDQNTKTLHSASDLMMSLNGDMLQLTLPAGGVIMDVTLGVTAPEPAKKRKKTARDKAMSKAVEEANARYRKKNGELRAGRTQADIMKLANKLADKMMKK